MVFKGSFIRHQEPIDSDTEIPLLLLGKKLPSSYLNKHLRYYEQKFLQDF